MDMNLVLLSVFPLSALGVAVWAFFLNRPQHQPQSETEQTPRDPAQVDDLIEVIERMEKLEHAQRVELRHRTLRSSPLQRARRPEVRSALAKSGIAIPAE